jgi:hypothetical protein
MALELLQDKGYTKELRVSRHPLLKTKYIEGLSKDCAKAQDLVIITNFYNLYRSTRLEYKVKDENVHNMDKKGVAKGIIGKTKAIISRDKRKQYMTKLRNRE